MEAVMALELPYQIANTDKVKQAELDLTQELADLKNEIEENEMVHNIHRPTSSVPFPKDVKHFRKERELVIKRAMKVCEARPIEIQAEVMQEELDCASQNDYTAESLPLLLHQFFVDRIHQLVQSKHMHMLRWKRFCSDTNTLETMSSDYHNRLSMIMSEYNDCLSRASRLSEAREMFLMDNKTSAVQLVTTDDLLFYLRWFVCHQHSVKRFHQFARAIQWTPAVHFESCKLPSGASPEHDTSRYHEDATTPVRSRQGSFVSTAESHTSSAASLGGGYVGSRPATGGTHTSVATLGSATAPTPLISAPPALANNAFLLSTNPLQASQTLYAGAASGGGKASNEQTLGIPLNTDQLNDIKPHLAYLAHMYAINMNTDRIETLSDEMELYGQVMRKFRQVFIRQETMKTFKTYDRVELGLENWGADISTHALKKEANWVEFVLLRPEKDLNQEKKMVELRMNIKVDELLKSQSAFLHLNDPERIQDALREHALLIKDPEPVYPHSVRSTPAANQTMAMWRQIYSGTQRARGQELDRKSGVDIDEFDELEAEHVDLSRRNRASSGKKRRDSYDYTSAAQQLGLDDSEHGADERNAIPGALLSFLMLRHLRIRDLQRTCLSVLNYFRSVERTITINDGGLSLEGKDVKHASPQNHRRSVVDGSLGGGGSLGSHQYLHNTPKDFKLSEVEFMEFTDVDNHDDFYMLDEGRIHVQDQKGYYIMYEAAVQDLKSLEDDLLIIATHYIQKDPNMRSNSGSSRGLLRPKMKKSDINLSEFSHIHTDRFGVLLDIWTHHTSYLECKREVLDCYLEAYHHVFDRDEKRRLAQCITDLVYKQPRLDFEAPYFVNCYRLECIHLRHHADLAKSFLDQQIEDERDYIDKTCSDIQHEYGLPHKIIKKQLISVNLSRPALKNVYLLEFHPSLAVVGKLPETLKHAFVELYHLQKPTSVTEVLNMENKLLEHCRKDCHELGRIGANYAQQAQKDIFCDVYIEDASFMCEIVHSLIHSEKNTGTRKSQRDKHVAIVNCFSRVFHMLSLRNRLFDSAVEAEILFKVYRRHTADMGFDDWHNFLRLQSFEFSSHKENAGRPPPFSPQAFQDDDLGMDRYTTDTMYLAIHELDEGHVGRLSFKNRDTILHLLRPGGLDNLQVALASQIVHKNLLMAALQQSNGCVVARDADYDRSDTNTPGFKVPKDAPAIEVQADEKDPSNPTSPQQSSANLASQSGATISTGKFTDTQPKYKRPQEAFISIQLEKASSRDLMINEYINKKQTMGMILKNPEEVEKLKRKLILEHCNRFAIRVSQYSLRSQIIAYYNSISALLQQFPDVRDQYFMFGDPDEKLVKVDPSTLQPDPREFKDRPRRVMSEDGQHVMNLWFIPHYTHILAVFRSLDDKLARNALTYSLKIAALLHDILHYLCAFSLLGCTTSNKEGGGSGISATWGGNEGIGSELHELQLLVDHLDMSTDPSQVCQLLTLRRDVMFLEYDTAVRHAMRDTFLSMKNVHAYKAVTECMHFALHELSNAQHASVFSTYQNVPEPLESWSPEAKQLYPWITFINEHGSFPVHFILWQQLQYHIQMCLVGLKEVDRNLANGEILGVSLLMEDVLSMGNQKQALYSANDEEDSILGDLDPLPVPASTGGGGLGSSLARPASVLSVSRSVLSRRSSSVMSAKSSRRGVSKLDRPIEAFSSLKLFLLLWKRLEICKRHWGKQRLGVDHLDSVSTYQAYCREYRREILFPVLQSIARRYNQSEMYEGLINDNDPLPIPAGVSEVEVRLKQLMKLLENIELSMISDVRKKVAKEMNLVQAERTREESALPTDLWKKPVIKESFTINRPHISEDFIQELMADCDESDAEVAFTKEHLDRCLSRLKSAVMARERHNYDSYTMYYENLLRVHHQLLYQKEQEVKQLTDCIATLRSHTDVEVLCQLADYSHDLIMEVTALRSKVNELVQQDGAHKSAARTEVVDEYTEDMQKLLNNSFKLRTRFDTFREQMADNFLTMVKEARSKAFLEIMALQSTGNDAVVAAEPAGSRGGDVLSVEHENKKLSHLLTTRRALHKWHQTQLEADKRTQIANLELKLDRAERECKDLQMFAEKEMIMMKQQHVALRKALQLSEIESTELKKTLGKELKEKQEKLHAEQQQAQSRRQLDAARRANMEKLAYELDDRDTRLQVILAEQDKNKRKQAILQEKVGKEVSQIKSQLNHERNLKLDAFQRVDDLQTCVYDYESGLASRPQTSLPSRGTRMSSAHSGLRSVGGGVWPPAISMPHHHRSVTPAADFYGAVPSSVAVDPKKIQRPKTTFGRLRSRIADQLINSMEPTATENQETTTVVKLEEVQSQLKEKVY